MVATGAGAVIAGAGVVAAGDLATAGEAAGFLAILGPIVTLMVMWSILFASDWNRYY